MNEIFTTQDGSHSLQSSQYGVSYHSKYGAVQESQHVFIEAALHPIAEKQEEISVLGIGMGTGLNVFMTYLESVKKKFCVDYVSFEKYPVAKEQINQLNYVEVLEAEREAVVFEKIHEAAWGEKVKLGEHFAFEKLQQDFSEIDFQERFDVIYFDAFAPNSQPELWEENIFQKMYAALKPEGVLTTYCAKGVVRRTMQAIGFQVERIPGPPGKREMLRAWKEA